MDDGFTTRAIRAATRVPRVDQPPSSVRISVGPGNAANLRADAANALGAARATSAAALDAATPTPATA